MKLTVASGVRRSELLAIEAAWRGCSQVRRDGIVEEIMDVAGLKEIKGVTIIRIKGLVHSQLLIH